MQGSLADAFIGIGSNLDHPARQVEAAVQRVSEMQHSRLLAESSIYRTAPYGGVEQPDFINAVVKIETRLSPPDLLATLQAIERAHGRDRNGQRWGPRVIDLDLLVYADEVISEPGLRVPHPGIAERNFVLLPLMEIAPGLVIPGVGPIESIEVNRNEPAIERII